MVRLDVGAKEFVLVDGAKCIENDITIKLTLFGEEEPIAEMLILLL